MLSKRKKREILCITLIVVGVGFCVGAIWIPLLLTPGVPILTAGLGIAVDLYNPQYKHEGAESFSTAAVNTATVLTGHNSSDNLRNLLFSPRHNTEPIILHDSTPLVREEIMKDNNLDQASLNLKAFEELPYYEVLRFSKSSTDGSEFDIEYDLRKTKSLSLNLS
jgi:hypothetical protein